jgi:SAM-dependent methyltransferase
VIYNRVDRRLPRRPDFRLPIPTRQPDRQMSSYDKRAQTRHLAASYLARGDATGWFEEFYRQAEGDAANVPWADLRPNPNVVEWLKANPVTEVGRRALVVGCGLGDDAEFLTSLGFHVTAFDISPSAIAWCRQRFPASAVNYEVGDLLAPSAQWRSAFDFVLEVYTLQVLPQEFRGTAFANLAEAVKPGGMLLVICRGRTPEDDKGQMPWPLLRDELSAFERAGLVCGTFEDFWDQHDEPPVRRFRVAYRRPSA